jgi:hypothetical protein
LAIQGSFLKLLWEFAPTNCEISHKRPAGARSPREPTAPQRRISSPARALKLRGEQKFGEPPRKDFGHKLRPKNEQPRISQRGFAALSRNQKLEGGRNQQT